MDLSSMTPQSRISLYPKSVRQFVNRGRTVTAAYRQKNVAEDLLLTLFPSVHYIPFAYSSVHSLLLAVYCCLASIVHKFEHHNMLTETIFILVS